MVNPPARKVVFFDLETQHLFKELGMLDFHRRDPTKLKLAIAGVLTKNGHFFFSENQIDELVGFLKRSDLVVGHNLVRFDYLVLQPYVRQNIIKALRPRTFDMMLELEKLTGCLIPLDDLAKRNLGVSKSIDTLKIPKMWRQGKHEEMKEYLLKDLKITEAFYHHGRRVGKIKYEHKEYGESQGVREVRVEW